MPDQVFTLLGTLIGGALGAFSPWILSRSQRHEARRRESKDASEAIFGLFSGDKTLSALLLDRRSSVRRQLYLYALRIEDKACRDACMKMVAICDNPNVTEDELGEIWYDMTRVLGSYYRGERT